MQRTRAMPQTVLAALTAGLLALGTGVQRPEAAETVLSASASDTLVSQIRRDCELGDGVVSIGVVPVSATGSPLASDDEAALTRAIEAALAERGVRTGLSHDAAKLIGLTVASGEAGVREAERIEAGARAAGEILLWPEVRLVAEGRVRLTLVAMRPTPACKTVLQTEVEMATVSGTIDVRRLMASVARRTLADSESASAETIVLLPFRSAPNTYGDCDDLVRAHLLEAFNLELDTGIGAINRAANERRLRVDARAATPSSEVPEGAIVIGGSWGLTEAERGAPSAANGASDGDAQAPRLWVSLEVRRGNVVMHARQRLAVAGLSCSARTESFTRTIEARAKMDRRTLWVHLDQPFFRVGVDRLKVKLTSARERDARFAIYCWYLADDASAYILVPNPSMPESGEISGHKTRVFPDDFGIPPQRLTSASNDLFHCFASERPIDEDLHRKWLSLFGAAGTGPNGEIEEEVIVELLARMRAEPGIVEAMTRIEVR